MVKKHNVSFAPLKLSKNLKDLLPAWLHLGAPSRTYHKTKDSCLQQVHNVKSVKDLRIITERLTNNNIHVNTANCPCYACVENRLMGCKDPNKCTNNAQRILDSISPIYNPNTSPTKDNLTLTHRRIEKNAKMRKQRNGEITFDPSITNKTQLSDSFRIFTNPDRITQIPAYRLRIPITDHGRNRPQLTMYTDGSCTNNGKQNASCGGGIWIEENHQLNKAIKVPGSTHSNQIGELSAILIALQSADPKTPLKIVSDSKYVIEGLNTHLTKWEDEGWIGVANATLFKAAAYHLRRRPAPTIFQWIKGHNGNIGNEKADELAMSGALHTIPDLIDTYVPRNFDTQGAKLSAISQKLAYMKIMNEKKLDYTRATLALLDVTRFAVETISSNLETDEAIWRGCRNKDISKKIQMFLYKSLNNAYRIGMFWETIPNNEHRAFCPYCPGEIESMEHILTLCSNPVSKTIWQLAKDTWPIRYGPWPTPHIGRILGCGIISLPNEQDESQHDRNHSLKKKGASRLLRILISESAHLIWTIRCERVIRESTHNEDTVKRRWVNNIDRRFQLDRMHASKTKRDTKSEMEVKATWSDILHNQQQLPHNDWVTNLEVLVGINLPRTSQAEVTR